jgi:hypothetical protein
MVASYVEKLGAKRRRRKLFVTTATDENAMAALAKMGERSTPATG